MTEFVWSCLLVYVCVRSCILVSIACCVFVARLRACMCVAHLCGAALCPCLLLQGPAQGQSSGVDSDKTVNLKEFVMLLRDCGLCDGSVPLREALKVRALRVCILAFARACVRVF